MVENCVLDWGAIATIAAAILTVIVAYCISKQWKTQKRVETVSNIAKEVYLDIKKFDKYFVQYIASHIDNLNEGPNEGNVYYGIEKELNPIIYDLYVGMISNLEIILEVEKDKDLEQLKGRLIKTYEKLDQLQNDILHVAIFSKDKILDDDRSRYHSIDIKVAHKVLTTTLNSLKKSLIKFIVYK